MCVRNHVLMQTFVASVFDVSPTGFSLYVERLDQYSWYGGRVLVSWIGESLDLIDRASCDSKQGSLESQSCALADRTVIYVCPLSHSRAPCSQRLTAWDSASLSSGASGSVAVLPSAEDEGFASNVVLEFPDSPFTMAPAVIATVRLAEGAPLGFAVTVSEVGLHS